MFLFYKKLYLPFDKPKFNFYLKSYYSYQDISILKRRVLVLCTRWDRARGGTDFYWVTLGSLDHHGLDFPNPTNSILLTVHRTPIFPRLDKYPKFWPWRTPRLLSRTASPSPTPSSSRLAT